MKALVGLLLAVWLLATCFAAADEVDGAAWPLVRFKTRTLNARQELQRQQRRRLLAQDVPSDAASQLFLLTHPAQLPPQRQISLVDAVESAGFLVASHVPDSSMLVVGPPASADAVRALPDVLLLAELEARDKLDPEWGTVRRQLSMLQSQLAQAGSSPSPALVSQLQKQLGFTTEWNAARKALMVAVSVIFPTVMTPPDWRAQANSAAQEDTVSAAGGQPGVDETIAGWEARRAAKVAAYESQMQAAVASVSANWALELSRRFEARVRRRGDGFALLMVPANKLDSALAWLSQQPTVAWVGPQPRMSTANLRASVITQSGKQPVGVKGYDPAFFPIWAAGIRGQGQTVGCGDDGLDMKHCFFEDPSVKLTTKLEFSKAYGVNARVFRSTTHRKISYYAAAVNSGDFSDVDGHGTHVVGSLIGLPRNLSFAQAAGKANIGMAPLAKVAFYDIAKDSGEDVFPPENLKEWFTEWSKGSGNTRIFSNSWGGPEEDIIRESTLNEYAWNTPDFLPVFAAGNDGARGAVGSPGRAKNALSVGSSETFDETSGRGPSSVAVAVKAGTKTFNLRAVLADFGPGSAVLNNQRLRVVLASDPKACSSRLRTTLKGAVALIARGDCFFVDKALNAQAAGAKAVFISNSEAGVLQPGVVGGSTNRTAARVKIPVFGILQADGNRLRNAALQGLVATFTPGATGDNTQNLAPYTSQGPTSNGRMKPDVVAPGTAISAAAKMSSTPHCGLVRFKGTSMATPVVAGSVILLRQYFMDGYYPTGRKTPARRMIPSGALLKAVLIGGSQSLTGVDHLANKKVAAAPSFAQGFGRINLGNSVYLANRVGGPQLRVVDRVTINQGEKHDYCITAKGGRLAITLAWTDAPDAPMASKPLVHDLDLTVVSPKLGTLRMDITDDDRKAGLPDRVNNVERVERQSWPAGPLYVTVSGFKVFSAAGRPRYALAVTGSFNGTLNRATCKPPARLGKL